MPEVSKRVDYEPEEILPEIADNIVVPGTRANPFANNSAADRDTRKNPFTQPQIPIPEPTNGEYNQPPGSKPPANPPTGNAQIDDHSDPPGVIVPQGVAKTQPEYEIPAIASDEVEPATTQPEWRYSKPELHIPSEIARDAQRALSGEEHRTEHTGHEKHLADQGYEQLAGTLRDARLSAGKNMADAINHRIVEVAREHDVPVHSDGSYQYPPIVLTEPPFTPSKRQVDAARRLPTEYIPEGLRFASGDPDAHLQIPEGVDLGDILERAGIDPFGEDEPRVLTPADLHKMDPIIAGGDYSAFPFVHNVVEPITAIRQDGHRWHPADPDINPDKYGLPAKFSDVAAPPKSRGDTHIILPSSDEGADLAQRLVGDRSYGRWGSAFGDPRAMSEDERAAWDEFADRAFNHGRLPFHIFPIEYKVSPFSGPRIALPDEITHSSARESDAQHRYLDDVAYGIGAAGTITRGALDRAAALDPDINRNQALDNFFAADTPDDRRRALLPIWRGLSPLKDFIHPILGHFDADIIDAKKRSEPPLFGIREDFAGDIRTRAIPITSDAVFRRLFEPDGFNRAVYERIARMHRRGEI